MHRRAFIRIAGGLAVTPSIVASAQDQPGLDGEVPPRVPSDPTAAARRWDAIERAVGGRLGVAWLDTGSGRVEGRRLDERFAMCSTFKWILAAHVLRRVDDGVDSLARRVPVPRSAMLPWAPFTETRVDDPTGASLEELCAAAVSASDNPAANLLVEASGGLGALNAFVRSLGDGTTRFDRLEPQLSTAIPGDPRDTTTPRAMSATLAAALVSGDALGEASRARLIGWLRATRTGTRRLRADWPEAWSPGDKTGSGDHGTTNDVAIAWPPGRPPAVVAAYLNGSPAPFERREAALAEVGRTVLARLGAVAHRPRTSPQWPAVARSGRP